MVWDAYLLVYQTEIHKRLLPEDLRYIAEALTCFGYFYDIYTIL